MLFWILLAIVAGLTVYFLLPKKAKPVYQPKDFSDPEPPVTIDPEAAKPDEYVLPETAEVPKVVKKKTK